MMRRRIQSKRDRVRQLRVFCEAARLGSVSAAAARFGLTQPAVSLSVRSLELEFGVELLDRSRAGVAVTPAGERLRALAEPLVRGVDALFGDFAGALDAQGAGEVRVAASSAGATYVAPRYVARFHCRHPDTVVRLETSASRSRLERLLDDEVDLALDAKEVDLVPGAKASRLDDRLAYRELLAYERVLICAPDHPLAARERVTPREALAWRAVVPPEGTYSRRLAERVARGLGIDIDIAVEVGGWGALKRYVEAGVGISVVPSLVVNDADRLSVVALDADLPPPSFGVFTVRGRMPTPAARRFLEMLAAEPERP